MTKESKPRIVIVQPVVPNYRKAFFSALAENLGPRFSVYSSKLQMGVLTENLHNESWSHPIGPTKRLFSGAEWQSGALSLPFSHDDVVVVSGAPRCLSNIALLLLARIRGARTVWWGQYWSATSRFHRFILRMALMRIANAVLFYTDAEVLKYKSGFGNSDRRPIAALNNGIDVKPIQKLRANYTPNKRGYNILFIGRLTEKSEISLLLQAMLNPQLKKATLHIIGEGSNTAILNKWTQDNDLNSRVVWHGATVDEAYIASVANKASIFCYPGGVGLSLIHAMAYGLPSVVHDDLLSHMPEIAAFKENITGLSFKKGDSDGLAKTLSSLLENSEMRIQMSHASIELADTEYNTDSMAKRFIEFIDH
ncbi:glycosyltransferase family 4 protein [Malikia granosa]|uniref:Glycosyl transferase family 1 domain-containing protein n=1 Tax=Malikia granosa TaxID=263067 RepID=A0A2S9K6H2_9BURK|nr:glycosyltransferase family 4 protein [Malikia granosa]PRD66021.1 hypothetical protein C6P64_06000 [Malikia granosa]